MLSLQSSLLKYQVQKEKKKGSKRGDIIGMFFEKFNNNHLDENGEHRTYIKDGKIKKVYPMTVKRLAMMLSPIKSEGDLYAFYKECEQSNDFCKYFFYKFK